MAHQAFGSLYFGRRITAGRLGTPRLAAREEFVFFKVITQFRTDMYLIEMEYEIAC